MKNLDFILIICYVLVFLLFAFSVVAAISICLSKVSILLKIICSLALVATPFELLMEVIGD